MAQFSAHLQGIASLEDLTEIRESLIAGATELKTYVDRMAKDSNSLVKQLKTEVSVFEIKSKAAEELVIRDGLTGLSNRKNVEERLEMRIARGQPFCVAILDLDKFKEVNATYGQKVGDSLLKQFAAELRSNSRPHDTVGRWGGDRIHHRLWIAIWRERICNSIVQKNGCSASTRFRPQGAPRKLKFPLPRLPAWLSGNVAKARIQDVIERADNSMYTEKGLKRGQKR